MKSILMYLVMSFFVLALGCQGNGSEDKATTTEMNELKSEEKAKMEMEELKNGGTPNLIENMKAKLQENKAVNLTEGQLNQIQSLAESIGLTMDLPNSEFKARAKELRKRVYEEVLTEEQRTQYDSTTPDDKNVFKK